MSKYKLECTDDYGIFELLEFNRDAEKFKDLESSMKRHGYIPAYPLHVVRSSNGLLKVKGGHHRLEVSQKLRLRVYFVVCDDSATIYELEKATNTWTQNDYLTSFVRAGNSEYERVKAYHERTGIALGCCISVLAGDVSSSQNQGDKFKSGTYKIRDIEFAELVADVINHCKQCGIDSTRSLFVHAISRCIRTPQFDVIQFKQKACTNKTMLVPQRSLNETMSVIEHVYNYGVRQDRRIPLAFLVDQAMQARTAVKQHGTIIAPSVIPEPPQFDDEQVAYA